MTTDELIAKLKRMHEALPPGKWVHYRYRNENGWWSHLTLEREGVPAIDSVLTLLSTINPNQESGGDVVEVAAQLRNLIPDLIAAITPASASHSAPS